MVPEKRQLFVIDDDKSVSRALKTLLSSHGFNVETYHSSEDFLNEVPNTKPGCLILDIMLPGLNGWETQQHLFKSGARRPVIFISANKDIEGGRRAALRGAVGFLQKPFHDTELFSLINQAFASRAVGPLPAFRADVQHWEEILAKPAEKPAGSGRRKS